MYCRTFNNSQLMLLVAVIVATETAFYVFIFTTMDTSQAALEYVNILADITIGKNLLEHYLTVRLRSRA
jgi:hypothetical protein